MQRREFLQLTSVALGGLALPIKVSGASAKVVVVGGGMGGATTAKYLRLADPSIQVTLVEANRHFYTGAMSNEVLAGNRSIDSIRFGYDALAGYGVKVVHDVVTGIDAHRRVVRTKGGHSLVYERCVVSPGIDFRWEAIDGYDASVADRIPHAWKAGSQTVTLRKQLEAMRDGGVVVVCAPPNPFRCPPGPYERVSLMAAYLKRHKPKSKILLLDSKDKFSMQGLFMNAWKKLYGYGTAGSLIEWRAKSNDGAVLEVDASRRVAMTEHDKIRADVINVIPPQKAGRIAFAADLADSTGWCPVDFPSFESKRQRNIHVIGDAAIASKMPKSGHAANAQAKQCAAAVAALLNGQRPRSFKLSNVCYAVAGQRYAFSVAMVYRPDGQRISGIRGSGGLTPRDASASQLAKELDYAHGWFDSITRDTFG